MKIHRLIIPLFAAILCSCSQGEGSDSEYFSSERAIEVTASQTTVDSEAESSSQPAETKAADSSSEPEKEQKLWQSFDEFYDTLADDDMIKQNYIHNSEVWANSGIQGQLIESGQDTSPQNELHLGKYKFGYNGCEVIAGYNMLTLLGEDVDMAKLISEYEKNILVASDGSFGCEPREIYLLLDKHGYNYETIKTIAECDKALDEGKSLIFSYFTGTAYLSEIHTICIIGGEDKYVLNRYNSVDGRRQISSISDITEYDKNVIIAYSVDTQEEGK